MERQKGFRSIDGIAREPGRRYIASRVIPRGEKAVSPVVKPGQDSQNQDVTVILPSKNRSIAAAKPALPRTAKSLVLRRQMIEHAKQHKQKVRKKHGKHIFIYGVSITTVLAAAAILWAFQGLLPSNFHIFYDDTAEKPVNRPIVQEMSSLDETTVSAQDILAHKMGQDEPKVLKIPSLGVEARVKRIGVSLSGEPIATNSIYDVGWFEASGKPGAPGAVLLNGHVSGPNKDGIFSQLRSLQPGDKIALERGDGQTITYTVQKTQEYSANAVDMNAATQPLDPSKQGLNLMTTINKFSARTDQSDKRLIIFALQ